MDFSIVIPMYNEQGNVRSLIEEIDHRLGGGPDYEIVCVDDGSTDATRDELKQMVGQNPRLSVLCHARNTGQSGAILSGVEAAKAPWVVTLDGDGQNDPADIPRLWHTCEASLDPMQIIVGRRTRRCDNWLKRISSRIANSVRRALLQDATLDTGCGLKLFSRTTFLSLPRFNHMHRFLPALFLNAGGRIVSIDVNHRPRVAGTSKYGMHDRLWTGVIDLLGVRWLQRRVLRPEAKLLTKKDIE